METIFPFFLLRFHSFVEESNHFPLTSTLSRQGRERSDAIEEIWKTMFFVV
jgi:hypothetical protein